METAGCGGAKRKTGRAAVTVSTKNQPCRPARACADEPEITNEQLDRVLAPILWLIREGRFDKNGAQDPG